MRNNAEAIARELGIQVDVVSPIFHIATTANCLLNG
jgi:hypothetical protein